MNDLFSTLFPFAILLLYLLLTARKSGKKTSQQRSNEEGATRNSHRNPKESQKTREVRLPPTPKIKASSLSSKENTSLAYEAEENSYQSMIEKGLSHQYDLDPAYKIDKEKKQSKGKRVLFHGRSLKDLVIIQEVMKRPYS